MPFGLVDLICGFIAPAVIAAGLLVSLRRWLPGDSTRSLVTVLTFVVAFQAGYWLLAWQKSLAPLWPTSHWHWLPEVMLLTVFVALPPLTDAKRRLARPLAVTLVTLVSAWVLVPTWDALEPSRGVHVAILTVTVVITSGLLAPLAQRYSSPAFPALLTAVMASGALVLALSGSLRFFQMAGCGVAALLGMTLASWLDRPRRTLEGIAFPFTLLISALMLIARVNSFSEVPLVSYVLPPLAPLSLWISAIGPLATATGWRRVALRSLPLLIGIVAVVFAVLPGFDESAEW